MLVLLLMFIGCSLVPSSESSKILMFHDSGTKSHLMCYYPLAEELLSRGHEVTGVYYMASKISHANYTEVLIRDITGEMMKKLTAVFMEDTSAKGALDNIKLIWRARHLFGEQFEGMRSILTSESVQDVFKQDFDVQISSSITSGYTAQVVDAPLIVLSPSGPYKLYVEPLGNIANYATVPFVGQTYTTHSFMERLSSLVAYTLDWIAIVAWFQTEYVWKPLGKGDYGLNEAWRHNASLVLSNSHYVTHEPQPLLENVVHVGGINIKEPKPLPADLLAFMDAAPQGVVLVSFGSSLNPTSMKPEIKQQFIKAIKELGMPVIWKWDEEVADLPKNVLISKWLPQQDLLAHPNLKVFVTHGGLLSAMEAIYHQTLLVGLPVANDQRPNILRMVDHNIAIKLELDELDSSMLVNSIKKALTDKSMSESMKKMSQLFRDTSERPVEKAAWWVEYVIRNNGAHHLKPKSIDLPTYKYMNLDIAVVLLLATLVSLYIQFKILMVCCRCCCGSKPGKQKPE